MVDWTILVVGMYYIHTDKIFSYVRLGSIVNVSEDGLVTLSRKNCLLTCSSFYRGCVCVLTMSRTEAK